MKAQHENDDVDDDDDDDVDDHDDDDDDEEEDEAKEKRVDPDYRTRSPIERRQIPRRSLRTPIPTRRFEMTF